MPRTDTGNFNRFLTSLGLLLLAAALIIPYFYFRNTEILKIPSADMRDLTETGRTTLAGRQDAIAAMEPWVIVTAIFLAILGVTFLVLGGLRLRNAQASEDEETELRKDRAKLEMQEMSPAERAEKVTEQAREEVAQEALSSDAEEPDTAKRISDDTDQESSPTVRSVSFNLGDRQAEIARVSDRIADVFRDQELKDHRPQWQVRIGSGAEAIRLDGVFESSDHSRDVLLKIRITQDPRFLRISGRNTANDLIATLGRYWALTGRQAQGWLVTVVPAESEGDVGNYALHQAASSLSSAMGSFGDAVVIKESELDSLPHLFRTLFDA